MAKKEQQQREHTDTALRIGANALGMSKTDFVLIFGLPTVRTLATVLAAKDADNVGADDEAARILTAAADALEKYLASKS